MKFLKNTKKSLTFVLFRIIISFVRLRIIRLGVGRLEVEKDKYSYYATLLNQCDKEVEDIYHSYALRYFLSDAVLWILYVLYDSPNGITQADMCNCWFFSRQTINTALKGLEQQGVIQMIPISGNRKSKNIVFSGSGSEMAEKIVKPLKQAENQVFEALSDEENKLFVELTQKRCSLLRKFIETE